MRAFLSVVLVLLLVFCSLQVAGMPVPYATLTTRTTALDTNSTDDDNTTSDANLTENIEKSAGNIKFIAKMYRVTGAFGINAAVKIQKPPLDEFRSPDNRHPGDKVVIIVDVQQGTSSLTLSLGGLGKPSVKFDTPLGEAKIPVIGVAIAGVNMDINSRIEAKLNITGPASTEATILEFTDWGSQEVELQIKDSAKAGSNIDVGVEFRYIASIGVSYSLGIWPLEYQKDIFSNDFEHIEGNLVLSQTVHVVEAPLWERILYFLGDLDGMPCLPWVIGIVLALIIAGVYFWRSRKAERLREANRKRFAKDDVVDTRKRLYKLRVRKSEYEVPED